MEIFFKDTDYKEYLKILKKQCEDQGVEIWSYCLMPNRNVHTRTGRPLGQESFIKE